MLFLRNPKQAKEPKPTTKTRGHVTIDVTGKKKEKIGIHLDRNLKQFCSRPIEIHNVYIKYMCICILKQKY